MSLTIRSLVNPAPDLQPGKAIYAALPDAPHTDESYHVGHNIDGFEVALNPAGHGGGPVASADVEDLDPTRATLLAAGATERDARVRSHRRRGPLYCPMGTAIPSVRVEGGSRVTLARRRLARARLLTTCLAGTQSGHTETSDCAWERTAFGVE